TLSSPSDRASNFSNFSLTNAVCNSLGPLFAGFSVDHAGPERACLYLAILSMLPLVLLALWGKRLPGGHGATGTRSGTLKSMLADAGVRRPLIIGSLQNTGDSLFQFYMPVYAHAVGLSASAIGRSEEHTSELQSRGHLVCR